MYKGIALSTVGALNRTDGYSMEARKVQALRLEAYPGMGSGDLAFLHNDAHMALVLLISQGLLPTVTNAEWNASGAVFDAVCARWQQEVRAVLHAVAGSETIDYIEIWNEPNGNIGAPTDTGLHPWNYAHLYRAAHDVIVHEFPKTKVISGGLFAHANSGADYLHDVLRVFPLQYDYIGWHPYISISSALDTALVTTSMKELHAVGNRPLFITETGWSVAQTTEALQAHNIQSMIETCRSSGMVEGVLIFTLDNEPDAHPALLYGIRNTTSWWSFPSY